MNRLSRTEGDMGKGVGEGQEREPAGILLFFEFRPENLRRAICLILSNRRAPEMKV